ncbi:uncharacterized protein LACBIDRAFT_333582 [Laccaria bicolor S238N-H82]|uniref:Predicted protein n=1 Tax=Laccaria bicolor (strain S238N-H82 / ATCC MYA-4686) TaxID=486041 RepID=B0DWE0_LACBS|nr:uncharacterized protein LACBIDRAFT_333582 [Laccaria bicolor S238N-H82]EDR01072.1 predicted protein [Laccaria bicolor S238N-H82]|eukprot:XP_001888291.1 predicted protein [Laccaria bicolor S238N-H82]
MNVNVTTSTNNIMGLDPRALQVVEGGGLHTLEIVAESADVSPLLKAAVVETLALISIVKEFNFSQKSWAEFTQSLIEKVKKIIQYTYHYSKDHLFTLHYSLELFKECVFVTIVLDAHQL